MSDDESTLADSEKKKPRLHWFGLGIALAVVVLVLSRASGMNPQAAATLAITTWCAVWWVTEPVSIPVTSLIPFFALPISGSLTEAEAATAYGHPIILLLLGGFLLSLGLESSGAHRRIAMRLVRWCGNRGGKRILLAFMLASASLSMWISNTATTLMLLPIALAVIERDSDRELSVPLLLGIAYAASIGGLGTPIGSPPNAIFMAIYRETSGSALSFVDWMRFGVPATLILLPTCWLWLGRNLRGNAPLELPPLTRISAAETRVLVIFALTATAWMTRTEPFGGWSTWLDLPEVGDSTIALAGASLLFWTPDGKGQRILSWDATVRLPWGLLLLFGGGIAIAKAFTKSGLSQQVGEALTAWTNWPVLPLILAICLCVTFLTEVTSNTATATLLMPVLAAAAASSNLEPMLLMVPAALSASCAFMLPVATAPNAIVFGSNRLTIKQMARQGFAMNLMGAFLITLLCYVLIA